MQISSGASRSILGCHLYQEEDIIQSRSSGANGRHHADQEEGAVPVKKRIFCRSVEGFQDQKGALMQIRSKTSCRSGLVEGHVDQKGNTM